MQNKLSVPLVSSIQQKSMVDYWPHPAVIARNHFIHKSLSCWSFNIAIGCAHACRFCYVADTSTVQMGPKLVPYGVRDPDLQWGEYILVRHWDEKKFLSSLTTAENTPVDKLNPDGMHSINSIWSKPWPKTLA